jgi:hypothetical protein
LRRKRRPNAKLRNQFILTKNQKSLSLNQLVMHVKEVRATGFAKFLGFTKLPRILDYRYLN